jgi:pimeloyl-ACP methyl ester carboxylesterase
VVISRTKVVVGHDRRIGVAWFGADDGATIVRLHGVAGSGAFEVEPTWTMQRGVRVITVERPGFGESDPTPVADLLDWADDVRAVADQLEIDRFSVFAESAGGPHAMAVAWLLRARVTAIATVGGSVPADVPDVSEAENEQQRQAVELARKDPTAAAIALRPMIERWHRDPGAALASMVSGPDASVLRHPVWGADLVAQVAEGTRHADGAAWDFVRLRRAWGFELNEVPQPVAVWQGGADGLVPPKRGRWLASQLPHGTFHLVEGHGHWLLYPRWRDIIDDLVRSP